MPYATMADAHREWHTNTGIPMGTPGCPQDACHLPDYYEEDYEPEQAAPVYLVVTAYGTETALTYEAAKATARTAAQVTGRAVTVRKV